MVTRIDGMVVITFDQTVLIFNVNDETYESGPQTSFNHRDHACAVFKSAWHNYREVVLVAGGTEEDRAEIWDYQTSGSNWISSKCNVVYD